MADKLIASTWNATETVGKLYVGDTTNPATLLEEHTGAVRWRRTTIDQSSNGVRMLAAGDATILYSSNGGDTWATPTIVGTITDRIARNIHYSGGSNAYYLNEKKLFRSVNSGANWADITPVIAASILHKDAHFVSDTDGFLLTTTGTPGTGGAQVFKSTNGGTSFAPAFDLESEGAFLANESPRRLFVSADGLKVWILTSHKLWKSEFALGVWTSTVLWNHAAAIDAQSAFSFIGAFINNGWNNLFTVDSIRTFDDLQVDEASGRIWLGGNFGLRAHSFDGTTFIFSDYDSVENSLNGNRRFHAMLPGGNTGFIGSSKLSPYLAPHKQGIWKTLNGGVSSSIHRIFDVKEQLEHQWAYRAAVASGCTVEDACNHDVNATSDDGSCQLAVQLSNCVTGAILHTATPEIVALGCREPRFGINIQGVNSLFTGYSVSLIVNGTSVLSFNYVVDMGLTVQDRLAAFIGAFIAEINASTSFTAVPIVSSQNPFIAGSTTGIWVTCPNETCSGQSVVVSQLGLSGVEWTSFDVGSVGSVVVIAEMPGQCFTVCGDGNCALAQEYTLVSSYQDCYHCVPFQAPTACRDCDTMLSIDQVTPAYTSPSNLHTQCISVGQELNFNILAGFPSPTSNIFPLITPNSACASGCPVTIQVAGNRTGDFPVGSSFETNETYTVADVQYDQGTDVTTIVSAENCLDTNPYSTVTSFTECDCEVRVQIIDITNSATLYDETFNCVNGLVSQVFDHTVLEATELHVVITAGDCRTTRTCSFWFDVCDNLTLCETDCHTYRLQARTTLPPSITYTISVLDVVANIIVANYTFTGAQLNAGQLIIMPDDGLYLVRVGNDADSSLGRYEILDLCNAEKCRVSLVEDVFCTANDPCEPTCNECDADRDAKRYLITRIGVAWALIDKYVYNYRFKWLGNWHDFTRRQQDLVALGNSIACLRQLASTCGNCGTPTSSKPCSDCP